MLEIDKLLPDSIKYILIYFYLNLFNAIGAVELHNFNIIFNSPSNLSFIFRGNSTFLEIKYIKIFNIRKILSKNPTRSFCYFNISNFTIHVSIYNFKKLLEAYFKVFLLERFLKIISISSIKHSILPEKFCNSILSCNINSSLEYKNTYIFINILDKSYLPNLKLFLSRCY